MLVKKCELGIWRLVFQVLAAILAHPLAEPKNLTKRYFL